MSGSRVKRVYAVFKTHFDAGFTGLASEVMEGYRTTLLEGVLKACEASSDAPENERYKWTMPAWPLAKSLEGCSPETRERAEAAIRAGSLVWHALPFTTHTEFCGLEEWIRGLFHSRRLAEKYGVWFPDAKMTDVPGHTWIVPSVLRKAGIRVLHLGCNPASTPADVPPVFWWEGPDGARLLTIYARDGYGSGVVPPEGWDHPVWLAMVVTGENTGTRGASVVEEMKAEMREAGMDAEIRVGTLDDFAGDLLARRPELPVVRGDLADSWIHGVGSAPESVARARSLRYRLSTFEGYAAWREMMGDGELDLAAVKAALDLAYEKSLLFGEHTWGMDCKTFLFPRSYEKEKFLAEKATERAKRTEASWAEQREYLSDAEASLASAVRPFEARATEGRGVLHVYNGLGWRRDGEVVVAREAPVEGMAWFDHSLGEVVEERATDDGLRLKVKALPPLGAKTLRLRPSSEVGPPVAKSNVRVTRGGDGIVLENERVRAVVDTSTGWLLSFFDRATEREWVGEEHRGSFGRYVYDVYSDEDILRFRGKYNRGNAQWSIDDFGKTGYPVSQSRETFSPVLDSVEVERGTDRASIVCRGVNDPESSERLGNPPRVEWRYTLHGDSARLDVEYVLHDKPETPLAESGHAVFPLQAENPQFRINKLGCVVDPRKDIVRSSNSLLYCCESWVDTQDSGSGLAVIPLDSPLFSIGRNAMWDYEPEYRPQTPTVFFNLFNNWWGTNFPQWIGGNLRYRFCLLPHAGDWRQGGIWKSATEIMAPPLSFCGELPESVEPSSLFESDLEGMSVLALKEAEEGEGYVLRLRDLLGVRREVSVELAPRVIDVETVDLLEYGDEKLCWESEGTRRVRLDTKPFEIHTLRLHTGIEKGVGA